MRVWLHRQEWACNPQQDFNSHTREGVTSCIWAQISEKCHFNSHTREGVTIRNAVITLTLTISTHTPVRVWQPTAQGILPSAYFNSHTREGVTQSQRKNRLFRKFQLTHPWGCDAEKRFCQECDSISTHTPVRVWPDGHKPREPQRISTHTPVRVWLMSSFFDNFCTKFQLTHPWGCDYLMEREILFRGNFNSHTREGVTKHIQWLTVGVKNFNSHTREGVTFPFTSTLHPELSFQLTHPWGCDQVDCSLTAAAEYFNSHTREGVTS